MLICILCKWLSYWVVSQFIARRTYVIALQFCPAGRCRLKRRQIKPRPSRNHARLSTSGRQRLLATARLRRVNHGTRRPPTIWLVESFDALFWRRQITGVVVETGFKRQWGLLSPIDITTQARACGSLGLLKWTRDQRYTREARARRKDVHPKSRDRIN